MRNILFISRAYGEHAGGMERLSFDLISEFEKVSPPSAPREALAKWGPGGAGGGKFEVSKIVNETKPGKNLFSTRLQSIVFAITVLPKALAAASHADIVHIGDPVISFVGWCITVLKKKPVAVSVHGLDVAYANPLYQLYLKLFFRSFSHYIPISEHAKQLLSQHQVTGSVTVIPPGMRDHLFEPSKTKQDLEKLLKRDIAGRTILATTGRLIKRKGHEWFIRNVLPKLPQNFLYVIAGSGSESGSIARTINYLGLEDRVLLLGRVSHEDQKILLNTVDVFIQPNIAVVGDVEGFGIAPLEAALCNRKVFASNIDGIPSAIHDGKNGVLLSPEDANAWISALTMIESKEIHAREYTLATFGWDTVIQQYERVFSE